MTEILDAIARARLADKRLRLAESLGDEAGVQVAYQAFLHNLFVIGEAVKAMPVEILEADPATPWSEFAGMREVVAPSYHRIVAARVHQTVEADLGSLDIAVRRLRAAQ